MNFKLLKRKAALYGIGGHTVSVPPIKYDEMDIHMKMAIDGIPINKRSVLLYRMKSNLDIIPSEFRPYAEALIELYERENI